MIKEARQWQPSRESTSTSDGGREFGLDRPGFADFDPHSSAHIVLGDAKHADTTRDPNENDPKKLFQPMDEADVTRFPRWIRFEGGDLPWEIHGATVDVTLASGQVMKLDVLPGEKRIVLSESTGRYLFF